MSKILDVNELLDLAQDIDLPHFEHHMQRLEEGARMLTAAIADHLDIAHTGADWERGFGGLCGVFKPKEEGQPMPEAMKEYDTGGDWDV
jgi:hypothetical protein